MVDEDEHKNRRVIVIQVCCCDCKYQIKGFADTRTVAEYKKD